MNTNSTIPASSLKRAICVLAWMANLTLFGQATPDIVPWLDANNVTWTVPGPTSSQSMPIGNGDLGLNVWVETNGAVDFYIGKSDAWGDSVQGDEGLMKVGGVRLTVSPNPFTQGAPFSQVLMLHQGEMQITEGTGANAVSYLVWVDANNPVIRVEASTGGTPVSFHASLDDWRLSGSNPDTVLTGQTNYVGWYHRNSSSDDSHIANWTYGALIEGAGMTNSGPTNLVSALVTSQVVSVYPLTTSTKTAVQWLTQLQASVTSLVALDENTTRTAHEAWWDAFWHRSWIFITGNQAATNTTEGYVLQRFISACAGRGAYPLKFNGSLFVVDNPSVPYTPDGRRWGGQYWLQNTRPLYWPLLESGDFDMMAPFFNMYAQIISNNAPEVQSYYGHGGSYSAETAPFWGGLTDISPTQPGSFTLRYYEGFMEVSMMMLDYYAFTGDSNFVASTLVPTASAGLDFYDQHFSLDGNGKMLLYPVNSLETYWNAYDPAPDIAGLNAILTRLLALPTNFISAAHQTQWARMLTEVPPVPIGTNGGITVLLPYSGVQTNQIENGENTQLYAVFPYRLYGLGKANLPLAISTYNTRLFYGSGDWAQDAIQAALLGITNLATQYTVFNFTNKDASLKFPAFWAAQNDYMPSEDNGGVAEDSLQKMIMQTEGSQILLLGAWPAGWNANFKLSAPYNTTVQGTISNGAIANLVVTPSSRLADVVLVNAPATKPGSPTNLTATAGNAQVVLNWTGSPGATSYNVKRSTSNGGSYTTIAGPSATYYDNTGLTNGTTYYYVVSATNAMGESVNSAQASATPVAISNSLAFASGTFTGNSVLSLVGSPGQELYGVSLGDGAGRTTANGYTFGSYPSANITYGGAGAYGLGGFLSGATSGDSGFDAVLDNAELGINGGALTLGNLTPGTTYNALFLAVDTRNGVGTRSFAMSSGSTSSAGQSYAFPAGNPALGGYVLATFVAAGGTQTFTNTAAGYGYQLNAVLVGQAAQANTPSMITAVSYNGSSIGFSGSNGTPNGSYRVLVSTNLTAGANGWTPIATNFFDGAGGFSFTSPLNPATLSLFYRLVSP